VKKSGRGAESNIYACCVNAYRKKEIYENIHKHLNVSIYKYILRVYKKNVNVYMHMKIWYSYI